MNTKNAYSENEQAEGLKRVCKASWDTRNFLCQTIVQPGARGKQSRNTSYTRSCKAGVGEENTSYLLRSKRREGEEEESTPNLCALAIGSLSVVSESADVSEEQNSEGSETKGEPFLCVE